MTNVDELVPGSVYHIYNRAVGSDSLFIDDWEYEEFLANWHFKTHKVVDTLAFCLLHNHFHLVIKVKSKEEICKAMKTKEFSREILTLIFAGFFVSVAKRFNFRHKRRGKLFMLPFRRREIQDGRDLSTVIMYTHRNPLHHGYSLKPEQWPFSSYKLIISEEPTWIDRFYVLNHFGGRDKFMGEHSFLNL